MCWLKLRVMNKYVRLNYFFLHTKIKIPVIMIACSLQIISCNLINSSEPIPAYVHIDSISFSSIDPLHQGSGSHKITDAWVYVDGNIVGTFELPATFPVLSSGSHKITIRPGILINGIAATRTNYPFYTGFDTVVNFVSDKTNTVFPHSVYLTFPAAFCSQLEDFDQTGTTLVKTSNSDTTINQVLDPFCFEGQSGKVYLDASHTFFECASKDSFPLPLSVPVYMELDYRSDNEFTIGMITYTFSHIYVDNIVTFKATDHWKKEYVNLGPTVNATANAFGYKIFIKATKSAALTNATLYFDNIKVIH